MKIQAALREARPAAYNSLQIEADIFAATALITFGLLKMGFECNALCAKLMLLNQPVEGRAKQCQSSQIPQKFATYRCSCGGVSPAAILPKVCVIILLGLGLCNMRYLCLLLFLMLAACSKTLSDQEYEAASQRSANWFAQNYELIHDKQVMQYFDELTSRLDRSAQYERASDGASRHTNGKPWTILVAKSKSPNAFSLGSRTIVVTTGLLTILDTEAELAAVIAHEMAHELLGHTREQYPTDNSPRPNIVFEPEHELAADELSIQIINHAAYDARGTLMSLARLYRPHGANVVTADRKLANERLGRSYLEVFSHTRPLTPGLIRSRDFARMQARVFAILHKPA